MRLFECVKPLEDTWAWTERTLFRPFSFPLWFKLGFLAWLANLTGNLPMWMPNFGAGQHDGKIKAAAHGIPPEIVAALVFGAIVMAVAIVLSFVALWVKSRGRFMFIDGILNGTEEPLLSRWKKFSAQGNGLFGLQILWLLANMALVVLLLLASGGLLFNWIRTCFAKADLLPPDALAIGGIAMLALTLCVCVFLSLLWTFALDFTAIRMYKTGDGAISSFASSVAFALANPVAAIQYLLCLALISIVSGFLVMAFVIATMLLCCIGCIALYIPFVWAVAILPVLAYRTRFAIEFAAQAGDDFDLLSAAQAESEEKSQETV